MVEESRVSTPEQFVSQFAPALLDYLERTLGKGDNHIEDMAAHASGFVEAFNCTINYF